MNSGKIALGILAAAATGAILGILFAPAKGAALRRKIYRTGEKEIDEMKDKFNEFKDNMKHQFEKTRDNVVDFTHQKTSKTQDQVKTAGNN